MHMNGGYVYTYVHMHAVACVEVRRQLPVSSLCLWRVLMIEFQVLRLSQSFMINDLTSHFSDSNFINYILIVFLDSLHLGFQMFLKFDFQTITWNKLKWSPYKNDEFCQCQHFWVSSSFYHLTKVWLQLSPCIKCGLTQSLFAWIQKWIHVAALCKSLEEAFSMAWPDCFH